MNLIDVIILVLLAANVARGFQRGLIMTIASLASYIAGWWTAVVYNHKVALFLLDQEDFVQLLSRWLRGFLSTRQHEESLSRFVEESLQETWLSLPLPEVARNWLPEPAMSGEMVQQTEEWLLDRAAFALTQVVVYFLAFVLIFLVVKHLTYFMGTLLHGIFQLPVLNTLNRGGGLLAGLVRGVLMVWILLIIATPFVASEPGGALGTSLRQSVLLQYLRWLPFA